MRVKVITTNGARQYQCTDELTGQVTTIEIKDNNLKELADALTKTKLNELKAASIAQSFCNVNPTVVNNLIKISKASDTIYNNIQHHANIKANGLLAIMEVESSIQTLIIELVESFATHDANVIAANFQKVRDAFIKLNDTIAAFNKVSADLVPSITKLKSHLVLMEERIKKIDPVTAADAHSTFNTLFQQSKEACNKCEEYNDQIKSLNKTQEEIHQWNRSTFETVQDAIVAHNEKLAAKSITVAPQSSTAMIYAQHQQTPVKAAVTQDQSPSVLSIQTPTTVAYPSRRDSHSSTPPQFSLSLRSGSTPSPSKKIAPAPQGNIEQPAPPKSCCSLM